jgi:hypothetical protein
VRDPGDGQRQEGVTAGQRKVIEENPRSQEEHHVGQGRMKPGVAAVEMSAS